MAKVKQNLQYNDEFPTRLRELIAEKQVTHAQIAEVAGVKRQTVGKWCTGETIPDILSITNIAKEYDISSDWLLGLSEAKSKDIEISGIVKYTGLSEKALKNIMQAKMSPINSQNAYSNVLNQFLESTYICLAIYNVIDYEASIEAEELYSNIHNEIFTDPATNEQIQLTSENVHVLEKEFSARLKIAIESSLWPDTIKNTLNFLFSFWHSENSMSEFVVGAEGFEISSMYEYRIDRYMTDFLREVEETAKETAIIKYNNFKTIVGEEYAKHNETD